MEIIIQSGKEEASLVAARLVARRLREKPDLVLGLATGDTPRAVYRELIRMHREEGLDFGAATSFNLDEYLGLAPDHPQSYHAFMRRNLLDHINIPPERTYIPDGRTTDVPAHCAAYEESLRAAGGIDLQILGIGGGGHIGFNEPGSSLASRTRIKTLTGETIADNARFFDEAAEVPHHVLTMGIGTILDSRECVLLAFGEHKAAAVAHAVEGPVSASCPASALQLHPHVKVFLDEGAAKKLERREYYRWVYARKPAWQGFE
ncbi:glucosamine-6-phosphate deaminase [Kiritimatiella glycovorans]|uniref:Glucosamine-6-phosphate deaminase n=1 Tax=Kiritimatiella glycovorans TaxID=1307763 RepID=A0A0G3EEB7_9BACT|nr:glucosamine-6-phosphate deaminase [Kiritimatiella glycovorans]AKJ64668.1 Glucosamine-6-phosphate deaminase [Kiritimatiella glycovorans]